MRRLGTANVQRLISLVAFGAAVVALHGALREFHYRDVVAYAATIPPGALAGALLLSFLSVIATSSLDLVALRHLGRRVALLPALVASFISTAVSNIASPALLTGGALRARLYAALGLSAEEVGVVVLLGAAGFWLGFLALAAVIFVLSPVPLPPSLHVPPVSLRALGAAFAAAVALYLVACLFRWRAVRLGRWELGFPALPVAVGQVAISAFDWLAAATALWLLAPDLRSVPFPAFLAVYLAAQAVGLASHVPAGLGVFEAVIVRVLAPHAPASEVLGALAVYRAVYYLAPLTVSLLALAGIEIRRAPVLESARAEAKRWLSPWVPSLLATSTFIAGAILLVSGATPGLEARMLRLAPYVPLPVIEASHFLNSIVGAALLLVARGLQQRLDGAYVLSALFLAAGMTFSLLKGLDYEEAALLAAVLVALLPARRQFHRRA